MENWSLTEIIGVGMLLSGFISALTVPLLDWLRSIVNAKLDKKRVQLDEDRAKIDNQYQQVNMAATNTNLSMSAAQFLNSMFVDCMGKKAEMEIELADCKRRLLEQELLMKKIAFDLREFMETHNEIKDPCPMADEMQSKITEVLAMLTA